MSGVLTHSDGRAMSVWRTISSPNSVSSFFVVFHGK